ncbi:tyrosine-type recombinase/integrase [Kitasatospora sp. NPDC006697]|uniref:tyrosine-type recombinase/integrase n=1 Tax=Kitasatospora sp. NPDC006697 TaxID=3364020 RepID=UPI0036806171
MADQTSYKVRIWGILEYHGARGTTYTVRWTVDGARFRSPFATFALAESFRSKLVTAAREGKAFYCDTGMPVAPKGKTASKGWYDFALSYIDMKWPHSSANSRQNAAKALVPVTVAMLTRDLPTDYHPVKVRAALREWAFNKEYREAAPRDVQRILRWVQGHSRPTSDLEDSAVFEQVMTAITTKLDGKRAAASSRSRNRRILSNALDFAVRTAQLTANPVQQPNEPQAKAVKTSDVVDKRSLLSPEKTAELFEWIRNRPRGGARLYPFFATLRYAGTRPEEAVALRVSDLTVGESGWGELLVHTATPEVGKRWTDSGQRHDQRHLKGREEKVVRPVPCSPLLSRILRQHIADEKLKPDDLLFQGEKGGVLAGIVYRRAWGRAREKVLTEQEQASLMGKRVYDLRHTRLTEWLNANIPPAQVAAWAGNSVEVLLRNYALCIDGQQGEYQRRIEAALGWETGVPDGADSSTSTAREAAATAALGSPDMIRQLLARVQELSERLAGGEKEDQAEPPGEADVDTDSTRTAVD